MRSPERLAGLAALWSIGVLVLMFLKPGFTNASRPQHGIPDPVLALQMAHNLSDVDAVLSDAPSADREVMRIKQYEDFGFIAGYAVLYVALAVLLARRYPGARWMAAIGALAGLAAAALDVTENFAVLRILDVKLSATTQQMIDAIHLVAMPKWALGFIALALLSPYFLWDRRRIARMVGVIDIAAALVGLYGLYDNFILAFGAALIALGLVGAAIVFLVIPRGSAFS